MVVGMVVSVVVFINVVFACCLIMHNIAPHRTTAAEAFISSSAVVQEGSPKDQ